MAVVAAATVGVIVLTGHHAAAPAPIRPPVAARPAPPSGLGLTEFSDGPVSFHAVFIAPPGESVHTSTLHGENVLGAQWYAEDTPDVSELLQTFSYPPDFKFKDAKAFLDQDIRYEVDAVKGTLLSQTSGTYQGFPSADAVLSFPASGTISAGYEQLRIVLAGHTEFDVIADGPVNPPKQFVQFAKSLKIITHAP